MASERISCWFLMMALLAAPGSQLLAAGDAALDAAVADRDTGAIVARMVVIAADSPQLAVRVIPEAYAAMEQSSATDFYDGDRYRIFMTAVACLSRVRGDAELRVFKKQCLEAKSWQARFVLLHASLQNPQLDPVSLALAAIKARDPELVALAARVLGNSAEVQVLDPLVDALASWESKELRDQIIKGRKGLQELGAPGVAWVACRDALEKLTGEGLVAAADYASYIKAHRGSIDPKKAHLKERVEAKTGIGLFGMDVTGRRIIFILDVSGSMEATDPLTPEQLEKLQRGLTGVPGDDSEERAMMEQRKRILRAKNELRKVVEALPEDRRFNLVPYSTEVQSWKETLVTAGPSQKKDAVAYIEGLAAKGVTVTDDALARAFSDPMVDTIYLITDGAPTHLGSSVPGAVPEDSRELMQRILQETRARNYLRQVRLFTLGFEGAEIEFLKQLSAENHGSFHTIE